MTTNYLAVSLSILVNATLGGPNIAVIRVGFDCTLEISEIS